MSYMTLNPNGTIGINTTTPDANTKLEVNGNIAGGSTNLDLGGASMSGYLSNIGWGTLIGINRSRGNRESDFFNFGGGGAGAGDGGFRFYVADYSDTNPVLDISAIGNTTINGTLAVNGASAMINGSTVCTSANGACSSGTIGGSGTAGKIPRYTTSGTVLGDSSISSDGVSSTANGNFSVTSNLDVSGTATVAGWDSQFYIQTDNETEAAS